MERFHFSLRETVRQIKEIVKESHTSAAVLDSVPDTTYSHSSATAAQPTSSKSQKEQELISNDPESVSTTTNIPEVDVKIECVDLSTEMTSFVTGKRHLVPYLTPPKIKKGN